jgi:hypothetical protein
MATVRLKASEIGESSRHELSKAEEIWLVDPSQTMGEGDKHPWMELIVDVPPPVPESTDPSAPLPEPIIVEVEVDSTHAENLNSLRQRIQQLAGEPRIEPIT